MNHSRYFFLDGIRGMAAVFVLIHHTYRFWNLSFYRSYLAVDVFFILSGFVIAHAYDDKIINGVINLKKFVLIRLIRLYPVFFLSILLCALLLFIKLNYSINTNYNSLSEAVSIFALTSLFLPSSVAHSQALFPINGPYWSLAFELLVNFFYAGIRLFLNNAILLTLIASSLLGLSLTSYYHQSLDSGFTWGYDSIAMGTCRSIFGIFLGLYLYKNQYLFHRKLEKTPNIIKTALPWIAFLIIAIILASPSIKDFNWIIDIFCVAIIFPFSVLMASQSHPSRFEKFLLMLGSASYPIYVLHKPFSEIVSILFHNIETALAPFSGIVLLLTLTALSVLIERYYDIPIRKIISNITFKKQTQLAKNG